MSNLKKQNIILRFNLIWALAKTDFLQRYYGSVLGLFWAFLNPLFRIFVYWAAFSFLIFRNRDPFFILYLIIGIKTWSLFSSGTKAGISLLKSKAYLIQSVQVNKLDLYIASFISSSFMYFLNLVFYVLFSIFYGIHYQWQGILLYPIIFVSLGLSIIGTSMIISAIKAHLKDFNHVWDMLLMLGFWSIPVIWPQVYALETYPWMMYINPITGVLINSRQVLMNDSLPFMEYLWYDLAFGLALFGIGYIMIKRFAHKALEVF